MANTHLTFKERVTAFWDWYPRVADRFLRVINDHQCSDLAPEVSAKIEELLPGFAWVFAPGAAEEQHSFTLSGEGDFDRQLLTACWLERAPPLPGWTFYAARQPSKPPQGSIRIGDLSFEACGFWITPVLDEQNEVFHLTVWHPCDLARRKSPNRYEHRILRQRKTRPPFTFVTFSTTARLTTISVYLLAAVDFRSPSLPTPEYRRPM